MVDDYSYSTQGWGLRLTRNIAHYLYSFPGTGLPRVAEQIRKWAAKFYKNKPLILINDFMGNLKFYCDLSEHMGGQTFFRGAYSKEQLEVVAQLLSSGSVFIDVGANQGEFSVFAASIVKCGEVHAFEPVSKAREKLERNLKINGFNNVYVHKVALSDKEEDNITIYGTTNKFIDGTEHCGLPTLYKCLSRNHAIETVNLRRLDGYLYTFHGHVDLIKIDVEGAELPVLKGAEAVIGKYRPFMIIEVNDETYNTAGYNFENLQSWLAARNYSMRLISRKGRLLQAQKIGNFGNILAIPEDKELPAQLQIQ